MGAEDIHISVWDLKGYIMSVILDWRQGPAGHSSEGKIHWSLKKPVGFPVCVLRPSDYFPKRVLAIEERYMRTLSDCIPTTHNRRCWRRKNLYLYIYESFFVCPAVEYATLENWWLSTIFINKILRPLKILNWTFFFCWKMSIYSTAKMLLTMKD